MSTTNAGTVRQAAIHPGRSVIYSDRTQTQHEVSKVGGRAVSVGCVHVSLFAGEKPMTDRVGQRGAPEIAQVSAVR